MGRGSEETELKIGENYMMKKLNITWDGVFDSTGYMFSFAKALCCAVKHSPFSEMA